MDLQKILSDHTLWLQSSGKKGAMANLKGADLKGADLDFSCWPLWCGGARVLVDERIACQMDLAATVAGGVVITYAIRF